VRRVLLVAATVWLASPSPAGAASVAADASAARAGLAAAVEAGAITEGEAARYGESLERAVWLVDRLPASRASALSAVIEEVAAQADRYDAPRTLTLFSMLAFNADYLASRVLPRAGTDVTGPDGVVYRAFSGRGLQFHPLANAARLNAHVSRGHDDEARTLAAAILARAVPRGGGAAVLEYPFDYHNVAAPWASGMAQAVAAQALARTAARLGDPLLVAAARAAYLALPGSLTLDLPEGRWVRLYEPLGLVVLNAQLQSAISLAEYAELAGDGEAAAFAASLRTTAAALLPRFDTGYWSSYSLENESSLTYHRYVVSLLRRLARDTGDPVWSEAADRFALYETQPPELRVGGGAAPVYPRAWHDSHRTTSIRFWVSKISDVTLFVDGKWRRTTRIRGGWNELRWTPPASLRLGSLPVRISARGLASNRAEIELPPLEVRRDRKPPDLRARAGKTRLYWRASDEASDRLRLRLRIARADVVRTIDLGRRPLRGAWRMRLPAGRWWALLEARDASGNGVRVALGRIA
jgi:hypothetical protein